MDESKIRKIRPIVQNALVEGGKSVSRLPLILLGLISCPLSPPPEWHGMLLLGYSAFGDSLFAAIGEAAGDYRPRKRGKRDHGM